MKKLFGLIGLILTTILFLSSCNGNTKYDIVVTNFPGYDAARAVTKDTDKSIKLLLTPGSDAHNYDPSANDIVAIRNCKVFVYVGGESDEEWVENKILGNANKNTKIISMFEVLDGLLFEEEDHDHEGEHNHEEGHEEEYDEHVWTDPTNFIKVVEAIKDALISVDSENKETYEKNTTEYKNELIRLDNKMKEEIANSNNDVIVVADRNPFLYFEKHYGIEVVGAFPGCSTVEAISATKKTALINAIKTNNLGVVFILETTDIENSAGKDIKNEINSQISSGNYNGKNVEIKVIYCMENPSIEDFDNGKTYLDMFNHNIEVIKEALN